MRGIGQHVPPPEHRLQAMPKDNTEKYVTSQVQYFWKSGTLIHPEIAREIAAWWASGDSPFTVFATTGRIDNLRGFLKDIDREAAMGVEYGSLGEAEQLALLALREYLVRCTPIDEPIDEPIDDEPIDE